jgi:hypothetical protein
MPNRVVKSGFLGGASGSPVKRLPRADLVHLGTSEPFTSEDPRARARLDSDVSVASQKDFATSEETLILFDYDDTLCPSFWAKNLGYTISDDVTSKQHQELLHQVATSSARTLLEAEKRGKVVIVTNAETGWIELSCKRWMPGLYPTISKFECVSARSTWEPTGLQSPFDWKTMEFARRIKDFYSGRSWKNILSLGDSPHERQALQRATTPAVGPSKHCRAKTLKFVVRPTPAEIIAQLDAVSCALDQLVHHNDSLDLALHF